MDLKKLTEYARQQRQADDDTVNISGNNANDIRNEDTEIYVPVDGGEDEPESINDIYGDDEDVPEIENQHRLKELKISEKVRILGITGIDYADELGISSEQASVFVRLNALTPELLAMVDDGLLQIPEAEILVGLKQSSQLLIYQTVMSNGLKITSKGAAELAKAKRLTEESIIKALKPKPAPKITLPPEITDRFFRDVSAEEAIRTIELALAAYVD